MVGRASLILRGWVSRASPHPCSKKRKSQASKPSCNDLWPEGSAKFGSEGSPDHYGKVREPKAPTDVFEEKYCSTEETITWPSVMHSMVYFPFSNTGTFSLLVSKLINDTFYKLQIYLVSFFSTLSNTVWKRQERPPQLVTERRSGLSPCHLPSWEAFL